MRTNLLLGMAWIACSAGPLLAEDPDWHLEVAFEEGSRLLGKPAFDAITVRTPAGPKVIPLGEIAFASLESGRWTVHRRNERDVAAAVTGTPVDASLAITSVLGEVEVPLARVRTFELMSFAAVPDRFPARRNLVMYLPFDRESPREFKNHVSPRHHATIENRVKWTKDGHRGGAVVFDGAGTLSIPHHAALCPEAFTLAMWVRTDDPQGGWKLLASKTDTGSWWPGYGFCRWPEDNRFVYFYARNYSNTTAKAIIPQKQWTHLAGTFDGKQVILYVNGEPTEPVALAGETPATTHTDTPFLVGGGNAYNWSGQLDELVFFNRALTIQELERLMIATSNEPDDDAAPSESSVSDE